MKFDCGTERKHLTEKQLAQLRKWREQGDRWRAAHAHLTMWHPWFAWRPVRLQDHDCRWLEWVERRKEFYDGIYNAGLMTRRTFYRSVQAVKDEP